MEQNFTQILQVKFIIIICILNLSGVLFFVNFSSQNVHPGTLTTYDLDLDPNSFYRFWDLYKKFGTDSSSLASD